MVCFDLFFFRSSKFEVRGLGEGTKKRIFECFDAFKLLRDIKLSPIFSFSFCVSFYGGVLKTQP